MRRYLLISVPTNDIAENVLEMLSKLTYNIAAFKPELLTQEINYIMVDKEQKKFHLIPNKEHVKNIVEKNSIVYSTDDLDKAYEFLTNTKETSENTDYSSIKNMVEQLLKTFSENQSSTQESSCEVKPSFNIKESSSKPQSQSAPITKYPKTPSFTEAIKPGRVILFKIGEEERIAVVLTSNIFMVFDSEFKISGYLTDATSNIPFECIKIYEPSNSAFRVEDYKYMKVVWEQPKKVIKKSLKDIEKELGLDEGTLQIE